MKTYIDKIKGILSKLFGQPHLEAPLETTTATGPLVAPTTNQDALATESGELLISASASRDRRRLSRIIIKPTQDAVCFNFDHSDQRYKILNLSYDGLGLESTAPPITNYSPDAVNSGTLHILGRSQHCRYYVVRATERNHATYLALRFVHENDDLLLFLRDFLEPMYWGQSLRAFKSPASSNTEVPQYVFRGDGPTTLKITLQAGGHQLQAYHLTFKVGDQYQEVIYSNNMLTIHQAQEAPLPAGNLALSSKGATHEQAAMQAAAAILMAANLDAPLKYNLLATLV